MASDRDAMRLLVVTFLVLLCLALSIIFSGCSNCRTELIPMYWFDGTSSLMEVTICDPD